ncbi:MAG: hypothetical protein CME65_15720 [Halobacteriovoraceae bacterium]|nr:hypothetical protein [Halobacteriovoraceae bacterium]
MNNFKKLAKKKPYPLIRLFKNGVDDGAPQNEFASSSFVFRLLVRWRSTSRRALRLMARSLGSRPDSIRTK